MYRQKFSAVVGLLLVLLAWAPMAVADDGLIDGLVHQLAVFLGLAEEDKPEMPYNPSPGGLTGEVENRLEMPYNPSPGG